MSGPGGDGQSRRPGGPGPEHRRPVGRTTDTGKVLESKAVKSQEVKRRQGGDEVARGRPEKEAIDPRRVEARRLYTIDKPAGDNVLVGKVVSPQEMRGRLNTDQADSKVLVGTVLPPEGKQQAASTDKQLRMLESGPSKDQANKGKGGDGEVLVGKVITRKEWEAAMSNNGYGPTASDRNSATWNERDGDRNARSTSESYYTGDYTRNEAGRWADDAVAREYTRIISSLHTTERRDSRRTNGNNEINRRKLKESMKAIMAELLAELAERESYSSHAETRTTGRRAASAGDRRTTAQADTKITVSRVGTPEPRAQRAALTGSNRPALESAPKVPALDNR